MGGGGLCATKDRIKCSIRYTCERGLSLVLLLGIHNTNSVKCHKKGSLMLFKYVFGENK